MDKMNYYAEPECSGDSSEDERFNEMGKFTREQMEEYFSIVGITFNESAKPIKVDYKIERGGGEKILYYR